MVSESEEGGLTVVRVARKEDGKKQGKEADVTFLLEKQDTRFNGRHIPRAAPFSRLSSHMMEERKRDGMTT